MTRINIIPPILLCNQHLKAEWTELPRAIDKAAKRVNKRKSFSDVPKNFTMGRGHETFFFNKQTYLINRFESVRDEMLRRGMNVNDEWFWKWKAVYADLPCWLKHNWQPSMKDKHILVNRLVSRLITMKLNPIWGQGFVPAYARPALIAREKRYAFANNVQASQIRLCSNLTG